MHDVLQLTIGIVFGIAYCIWTSLSICSLTTLQIQTESMFWLQLLVPEPGWPVNAIHELSYHNKLYTIGCRGPKYMQGQGKDLQVNCVPCKFQLSV